MFKKLAALILFAAINFPSWCFAEPAYSAPFFLKGGHLQTIIPYFFAKIPVVIYRRERWELDDGDFLDVDWTVDANETSEARPLADISSQPPNSSDLRPIVVIFHGLEGSSQSHYAKALMHEVSERGWRGVVVHFRGCSGEPNRLPRVYYAGDSNEIELILNRIKLISPNAPVYAVGYSLGGNALLKWLGESQGHSGSLVKKAVAISAPMDLVASANALDSGLNRFVYVPVFVKTMKTKALDFVKRFPGLLDAEKIEKAQTIHDIDNAVTAVLYGATDAEDYYAKNSSKPWLNKIEVPTLIINAKNDPFMPENYLPTSDEVSASVQLEYLDEGGHVGFAESLLPVGISWLPNEILNYFDAPMPQTHS